MNVRTVGVRVAMLLLAIAACTSDDDHATAPTARPDAGTPPPQDARVDDGRSDAALPPPGARDAAFPDGSTDLPQDGGLWRQFHDASLSPHRPAPQSTATISVYVRDTLGRPVVGASVRAGGRPEVTDSYGIAELDDVRGVESSLVMARADLHLSSQVQVDIVPAGHSAALLVLQPAIEVGALLVDTEQAISLTATGQVESAELRLPPAALTGPWGGAAVGPASVIWGVQASAPAFASLPEHRLSTDGHDARVVLGFVVEMRQGGDDLILDQPVHLNLQVPGCGLTASSAGPDAGPAIGTLASPLKLYWFDRALRRFVDTGTEVTAAGEVSLELANFGRYVLGTPQPLSSCLRTAFVADDGSALSGLAVHHYGVGHSGFAVTDDRGEVCLDVLDGRAFVEAYGVHDSIQYLVAPPAVPLTAVGEAAVAGAASCASGCPRTADIQVTGTPMGCIVGTLSGRSSSDIQLSTQATVASGVTEPGVSLPISHTRASHVPFCVELPAGQHLVTAHGPANPCIESTEITVVAGRCGSSTCADLGQARCCSEFERCEMDGWDDDCDGQVDEGCTCGGVDCALLVYGNSCCTGGSACGMQGFGSAQCFPLRHAGTYETNECPDEAVLIGGTSVVRAGCCRPDGRCGLAGEQFGCVAREELHLALDIESRFSGLPCGL